MEQYLLDFHKSDIVDVLNDGDDNPAISVNLTHLHQFNLELFSAVLDDIHKASLNWSNVLLGLQKSVAESDHEDYLDPNWVIKESCRVRFENLPSHHHHNRIAFPTNDDAGKFVQIRGTVLRTTQPKFLEHTMVYICEQCKNEISVQGEYGKHYITAEPNKCPNGCKGKPIYDAVNVVNKNFITYQEIKIMEAISNKSTPSVMEVTLENDLVESCLPGDSVAIWYLVRNTITMSVCNGIYVRIGRSEGSNVERIKYV